MKILLFLSNRENRKLLCEWLKPRYDYVDADSIDTLDQVFDLCIVDGPMLSTHWEWIQSRRNTEKGVFLPFLLIALRQDLKLATRHLWKSIDELLLMPIEKIELHARIEVLLRARRISLQLERSRKAVFQGMVEQSIVGIYEISRDRLSYFNEAGAQIFGYPVEELVGSEALRIVHPEDRESVVRLRRATSVHFTFRGNRKDGVPLLCEAFEREVHLHGKPVVLGTLLDITEKKRLEDEHENLQREQVETLRKADRIKDEFLSVISHELRTPLNAITGFGSILQDEIPGPLNPQQLNYLDKLLAGTNRMLFLIDDLLDYARIQAGNFSILPAEADYASVVEETIALFEATAAEKGISIRQEIDIATPVKLDRIRITQVLANLLSNALKFTTPGGRILIRAWIEGDALNTNVQDTGIGMLPEDLSKIFQPFKQLDMGSTRTVGGVGLGLSICKAIVGAHGGTIEARSEVGKGSTFTLRIPVESNE